jgi:hypothetical protein
MKYVSVTVAALLPLVLPIAACGVANPDDPEDTTAEVSADTSDPVPGLAVGASMSMSGGRAHGVCDVTWTKDSTHDVTLVCSIEKQTSGQWFNQTSTDQLDEATTAHALISLPCSNDFFYRVRVDGRVRFSGGLSPIKSVYSGTHRGGC